MKKHIITLLSFFRCNPPSGERE